MALKTTVIGMWRKPDFLQMPDWFRTGHNEPDSAGEGCIGAVNSFLASMDEDKLRAQERAVTECIREQKDLGIDVITDGEMARENYVHHFCRQMDGFDFENLKLVSMRNGACKFNVCVATDRLKIRPERVDREVVHWKKCQEIAGPDTPVKFTIPGPMTIINTTAESYYAGDTKRWSRDLVAAINTQVTALAAAGCRHIQVDEPLMVRQPDVALSYGIDHLSQCFEAVGDQVFKTVHLCCGYPDHLDQENYAKAPNDAYLRLAPKLDSAGFDAVSVEDAHRRNDLSLFRMFKKTRVIVGSVKIASSQVESVDEIRARLQEILTVLPASQVMVAPDCGLGFLPEDILRPKLSNMVDAARTAVVN